MSYHAAARQEEEGCRWNGKGRFGGAGESACKRASLPLLFPFSVLMGERREEDSWNFHYSMEVKDQVLFGSLDL